jgi:hypothetical protein
MNEFVSGVKVIPYDSGCVFTLLSDLSNLEKAKDRIRQEDGTFRITGLSFDADSCTFDVEPVGKVGLRIVERNPVEAIKFEAVNSPVPLNLWICLEQFAPNDTRLTLTVRTEMNSFLASMLSKRLQEGIDKLADILADLPYATLQLNYNHT